MITAPAKGDCLTVVMGVDDVEDNAEVAEAGRAYLEQLGYAVRHAPGAQARLDILAADAGVDLVFSDILMPGGMNGVQLAEMVRRFIRTSRCC